MKSQVNGLLKISGVTALTLALAVSAFVGVNHAAFAAATQPEKLPAPAARIMTAAEEKNPQNAAAQPEYKAPKLTVLLGEEFDEKGKPCLPGKNAMSPEEAAQIGARYIWDMTGESIDGKTVEMSYSALPFSAKTYWRGVVANPADDLKTDFPEPVLFVSEDGSVSTVGNTTLYSFHIDAVTGERVSIDPGVDIPTPENYGEGKVCVLTQEELEAMRYNAPANVDEYAEIARAFAEKHFNHSTVERVDFRAITLNYGNWEETARQHTAYAESDKSKPFTYTIYEKGRHITFDVTDSTGRVASVGIDVDSKQATSLSTFDNDIVPGYPNHNPKSIG
jgi:hypothetical protein